jgi:cell division protein FtsB
VASAKALLETLKAEKVEVERIAAEQAAMEAEADTLKEAAETAAPPVAAADDH